MGSGLAIEEKSIAVMNYFHPCYALLFNMSRIHSGPVFAGFHFPSMELQSCIDTRRTSNHVPGIRLYLLTYLTTHSSHRNNGWLQKGRTDQLNSQHMSDLTQMFDLTPESHPVLLVCEWSVRDALTKGQFLVFRVQQAHTRFRC